MKIQNHKKRQRTYLVLMSLIINNAYAEIYVSENVDGISHYATQPLNSSFKLLFHDAPPPLIKVTPKKDSNPVVSRLTPASFTTLDDLMNQLSVKHAIEPALVRSIAQVESHGNSRAISPRGAQGAMQLMPATAAQYGVTNSLDPAQNIEGGILHMKYLLARHHGNVALALAAYNAGEGAVARHASRIPPFKETMLYVPAVLARLQKNRAGVLP